MRKLTGTLSVLLFVLAAACSGGDEQGMDEMDGMQAPGMMADSAMSRDTTGAMRDEGMSEGMEDEMGAEGGGSMEDAGGGGGMGGAEGGA